MSHPNTDRDERVREIRGRQERCMRPDRDDVPQRNADPLARELSRQLRQAQMDRGYLLSLLDSQAAERTNMRDLCLAKVRELAADYKSLSLSEWFTKYGDERWENVVIPALESITLEEQETKQA